MDKNKSVEIITVSQECFRRCLNVLPNRNGTVFDPVEVERLVVNFKPTTIKYEHDNPRQLHAGYSMTAFISDKPMVDLMELEPQKDGI
jgi:hypothetical protein